MSLSTPILSTISDLCAHRINQAEAVARLNMLNAQPWIIERIGEIEAAADHLEAGHIDEVANDRFRDGSGSYVMPSKF